MELKDFQKDALQAVEYKDRCAFFHSMGLGKTFTGSAKLLSYGNSVNLVVCQKSKVSDWYAHFKGNFPEVRVFDLTKGAEQGREFTAFLGCSERKVGVINYDLLIRRPKLYDLQDIAVIFDESSMLKNDQSKRTKCAMALHIKQLVLLSGTPMGGKFEELYTQCRLLGWTISKDAYWDQYVYYTEWRPAPYANPVRIVRGYKHIEELKRMLSIYGAHFLKTEDVLTLPPQIWQTISVPCSRLYTTFMRDGYVEVQGEEVVGDMPLKKLLYARQLCSIYSTNKLTAFKDLVESTCDRLVVFYNFTGELYELQRIAAGRPQSVISGAVKDLSAYENASDSVTFVQYQAGAMGLNLQKANRMVFYSLPLSSELYEQAQKRIHRIGQDKPCFYYLLICSGSIEEKIQSTLAQRHDYTMELFTNEWDQKVPYREAVR